MTKFSHGQVVVTRAVHALIEENETFKKFVNDSLNRHISGDWGDLDDEDKASNEMAIKHGDRIFSTYKTVLCHEKKIWIITEADRSATTVLFPSDY